MTITADPVWAANVPHAVSYRSWAVPCTRSGGSPGDGWAGTGGLIGSGQITEMAPGDYTFTITCGTGVSMSQAHVTVTVPPPAVTISVNPADTFVSRVATLTWNSTIYPCRSDNGPGVNWGGALIYVSGSLPVFQHTPGTYTYSITCGTGASTVHASADVTFGPAPITIVTASADSVSVNTPVMLTWTSPGASSCTLMGGSGEDGWMGTRPSAGTETVSSVEAGVVSYGMTCDGLSGGVSVTYTGGASTSAATKTPAVTLSVDKATQVAGRTVSLSWNAQHASQCTALGGGNGDGWSGTLPLSGSMSITEPAAGNFTYTLTCAGAPPADTAQAVEFYRCGRKRGWGGEWRKGEGAPRLVVDVGAFYAAAFAGFAISQSNGSRASRVTTRGASPVQSCFESCSPTHSHLAGFSSRNSRSHPCM